MLDVGWLFAVPPIEIGGFKMIDAVRTQILSEKSVLKFPERNVPKSTKRENHSCQSVKFAAA